MIFDILLLLTTAMKAAKSESTCLQRKPTVVDQVLIDEHNRIRKLYDGLGSLCYSQGGKGRNEKFIVNSWIDTCIAEGQLSHSAKSLAKIVGENLGEGEPGGIIKESVAVVRNWFRACELIDLNEIDKFDLWEDEKIRSCVQMLWKGTTDIDCAARRKSDGRLYVVCQYYPRYRVATIEDNIVPLSDWNWKTLGQGALSNLTFFDFNNSTLQIKTSTVRGNAQIVIFSPINRRWYRPVEMFLYPLPTYSGMRTELTIRFCIKHRVSFQHEFKHSKATIVITIFLSTDTLDIFINGKEFGRASIPDILGKSNICMRRFRPILIEDSVPIAGKSADGSSAEFRILPSSRFPDSTEMIVVTPAPKPSPSDAIVYETEIINHDKDKKLDIPDQVPDAVNNHTNNQTHNRHYLIKDRSGKEIRVTFPAIHTDFKDNKDGSVTVYFDQDEPFEEINSFQLIVQHYDKNQQSNQDPISYKDTLFDWQYAERVFRETQESVPYIAAQVAFLGDFFVLGDEKTYGGYYNGKLVNGRKYSLRLRGIVKLSGNETAVLDTKVVGTFNSTWATFFSVGTALIILIAIIGFVVFGFVRARREKRSKKATIAKLSTFLEDKDDHHFPGNEARITSQSDTWWEVSDSESEEPTGTAPTTTHRDYQDHSFSPHGEEESWDPMRSTTDLNTTEFTPDEAATKLLSGSNTSVVRRSRGQSRTSGTLSSDSEMVLPDTREDEIYHF